jgi:hypothetical protein
MKLRHYELLCLAITLFLGYEFAVYNHRIHYPSVINLINLSFFTKYKLNLDPTPGYPLSYRLGWMGFITMCITNFYILRKRFGFMKTFGKLPGWLDFHIFCGMLGPIFIIFHTNFKVNGLVAISFWSMIISASSGVFGRYFYMQTLSKKVDLVAKAERIKKEFIEAFKDQFEAAKFDEMFVYANTIAGVKQDKNHPVRVFLYSVYSDIKLSFINPGAGYGLSKEDGKKLARYGVTNRRALMLEPFNLLLGYWHSFHLPFAFFMYIVAIIHIATALLLGVKH